MAISHCCKTGFRKQNELSLLIINVRKIENLNTIIVERGQTLAQMTLAWLLKDQRVTSVLIGASRVSQLLDSLEC